MKKFKLKYFPIAFAVVLAASLLTLPAHAQTVSYYLDQNNAGLPDANYLKVTISDGSDSAIDFMVEVLSGAFPSEGSNFGMQEFYFNFDDSLPVTAANISMTDPAGWSVNTDKNAGGGFGKFDFELKGTGSSRTDTLMFSIVDVAGDTPEDYATGNSEFFAAHVADFSGFPSSEGGTKFAGSTQVPIPGAVVLLASGLFGVIFLRRKRSVK